LGKARKEAAKRLYEIAEGQDGFFTTKQAKAAGFAENTHPYHVSGEIEKADSRADRRTSRLNYEYNSEFRA
jgi:hypothetical protein